MAIEQPKPLSTDPVEAIEQLAVSVPPGYDRDRCHSCGAAIFWGKVQDKWGEPRYRADGKRQTMPLNVGSTLRGTMRTVGAGEVRQITGGEMAPEHQRFVSHHATCPQRKQWQRRGGGGRR